MKLNKTFTTNLSKNDIQNILMQEKIQFSDWYYTIKEISDGEYSLTPKIDTLGIKKVRLSGFLKVTKTENGCTVNVSLSLPKSLKVFSIIYLTLLLLFEIAVLITSFTQELAEPIIHIICPVIFLMWCLIVLAGSKISSIYIFRKLKELFSLVETDIK